LIVYEGDQPSDTSLGGRSGGLLLGQFASPGGSTAFKVVERRKPNSNNIIDGLPAIRLPDIEENGGENNLQFPRQIEMTPSRFRTRRNSLR